MTELDDRQVEDQLREMTAWPGDAGNVWKRAAAATPTESHIGRLLRQPLPRSVMGIAAAIVIVAITGVLLQLQGGGFGLLGKDVAPQTAVSERNLKAFGPADSSVESTWAQTPSRAAIEPGGGGGGGGPFLAGGGASRTDAAEWDGRQFAGPIAASGDRAVVRKATIELRAKDVRAAYLKASHMISTAQGEFIGESALHGDEGALHANLTMRIRSDRLDNVLNELRELGEVVLEEAGGEDVTVQLIDLEARLRNEERVETELLELLESRTDAPLKEILDFRSEIARVREQIERYRARLAGLDKLVSLATILVIIRPNLDDEPGKRDAVDAGVGDYFFTNLGSAWKTGLTWLADSIAFLVRTIIGGIVWWLVAVLIVVFIRHLWRRTAQPQV